MNIENNIDTDKFIELLAVWKAAIVWKISTYVALKTPKGPILLFGRVEFICVKPQESNLPFTFESKYIMAGKEIDKIEGEDVDKCVLNAASGKIASSKGELALSNGSSETFSTVFFPIYHPSMSYGPRIPSLIVRGKGWFGLLVSSGYKLQERLDWDLKAADQPFASLDALFQYLGFPILQQCGDSSSIEVVVNSPVMILEKSVISGKCAFVKCEVAIGIDTNKIKLGYKIFHKDSTNRSSLLGNSIDWEADGKSQLGTFKIEVGDAPVLQAFISYDGVALHEYFVQDPLKRLNQNHVMHETFDKELGTLWDVLLGPDVEKQSRSFEGGVAWLLSILGFSVLHYSKPLTDAPDTMGSTPRGNVLVVECTVGLVGVKDKLAKLVRRTVLLKGNLESSGFGFVKVQPVIVTALKRKEVEAHFEEASKNNIAVISREDLENLLERVKLPTQPEELFKQAADFVPKTKQPSIN